MMKKSAIAAVVIGLCVMTVWAFSSVFAAQPFKWPPLVRIATPGTQSAAFASTNGWGPKFGEAMGTQVRIIPVDSEVGRYVRFTEGKEFELDTVSIADTSYAIQGMIGYADKRAYPVRAAWHHNDTPWAFVVRGDSKFKTIQDLKQKGVRVAVAIGQPPMVVAIKEALPAFLGWTKEEAEKNWTFVPASSYAENCRTVTDGKADVAYVATISSVTFEMEAHPAKIRWLALPLKDKAAWKRWLQVRPTSIPTTMDFGVPSSKGVDSLASNFIYWTRADVDQEMVYQMAKWFHQQYDNYKDTHNLCTRMSVKHFRSYLDYAFLPVAEGTVRYLKEIKQWTAADDKWNAEAIALMDRWVKARNAALDEAKAKGVKIDWQDKDYLAILAKHTKDIPVFMARLD
ncbi:MAG: TAXI family TRAP transporter solute-binding subunit [Deltaproteobacteria bacterium]|nr:TAXI family TRAP transporter solute-binding subunit [Deltaproteobacteria bacterium]